MSRAIHICFEGTEGCYKTTNVRSLADALRLLNYNVLETKEPGSVHLPLTMILRGLMLDSKHEKEMTRQARELISQAIRSIHITRLLEPSFEKYDFIIQDRGSLSGIAYGVACGNSKEEIVGLLDFINDGNIKDYDLIIYLQGEVETDLNRALASKQEFETGDVIEGRGINFIKQVESNFHELIKDRKNVTIIDVVNKNKEEIASEILDIVLKIKH